MPIAELTDVSSYYELAGKGDPIVLLPGLGATAHIWDSALVHLAESFSVVRFDNRGVGRSVCKRQPVTLNDYSADLVELLDFLQLDRAHVLGLSLGGMIAQRFAIDHPSRVNRLVLVSCANRFGPYLREMLAVIGQAVRRFPARVYARTMSLLTVGPPYLDTDPSRINMHVEEHMKRAIPRSAVAQQLRCLAASDPNPSEYDIHAPTLVIAGEHDVLIPHCYAEQMANDIPGSRFVLVSKVGHNPFKECPERILPTIVDFLQGGESNAVDQEIHVHKNRLTDAW